MNRDLSSLVSSLRTGRVLVLGDVMLDEYVSGDTDRVSPEAPVPVVSLKSRTNELGGAANAAKGIVFLGGQVTLAGVVGKDTEAESVRSLLSSYGVGDLLVGAPDRPTTTKTRVLANNQQVVRIDREDASPISRDFERRLVAAAAEALTQVDCVLLSDYAKGVVSPFVATEVIRLASGAGVPVVVDPKGVDFAKYRNATVVKPNRLEAFLVATANFGANLPLEIVGPRLVDLVDCAVLVTLGADGMRLFERDRPDTSIRSSALYAFDVTGAGDTVAAVLALGLAGAMTLLDAASLAAAAAAVVVGKVGTGSVSTAELLLAVDGAAPECPVSSPVHGDIEAAADRASSASSTGPG